MQLDSANHLGDTSRDATGNLCLQHIHLVGILCIPAFTTAGVGRAVLTEEGIGVTGRQSQGLATLHMQILIVVNGDESGSCIS